MRLDFIDNINAFDENMVRLYDFDSTQAKKFREILNQLIIEKTPVDLSTVKFIKARNCNLTLRISEEDAGISTSDKKSFFCDLTVQGYEDMIKRLEPFCTKETKGYQWLYEIDTLTDFLFSPAGTW